MPWPINSAVERDGRLSIYAFTVTVTLVVCEIADAPLPSVPVTVTLYVPLVVLGILEPPRVEVTLPPPPQPNAAMATVAARAISPSINSHLRRRAGSRKSNTSARAAPPVDGQSMRFG